MLSWALGLNLSTRFWVTRGLGLISTFKVWLTSGERLLPFRACVHYFYQFLFFFSSNDRPSKSIKKCFLFHLKSSFCSQDIQTFVFSSSPLFLPVSHCVGGCLKVSLKVYDVINCLNKNLITHCVWYLGKEKKEWHWNFINW